MITLHITNDLNSWTEDTVRHLGYEPGRAIHRIGKAVAAADPDSKIKIQHAQLGLLHEFRARELGINLRGLMETLYKERDRHYAAVFYTELDPIQDLDDLITYNADRLPPVFVDMDDVVADFSSGFCLLFNEHHVVSGRTRMWELIDNYDKFYEHLPLSLGAYRFIEAVAKIPNHAFLSSSRTQAIAAQKERWLERCSARAKLIAVLPDDKGVFDKSTWATPGAILIDDYGLNVDQWEAAGGDGIRHYSCAASAFHLTTLLRSRLAAQT